MSFQAVGINSRKEYAMAQYKAELMKKLALIYPTYRNSWRIDGTRTKQANNPIYPEPLEIINR
ncbi:hypothetical protein A7B51_00240 [Lentilactobacillus parabuchneri]|uniref:hypothetical protein n=1 Tax=Lentilactobacillus parabuchneri TaxID=152331 RepID=UPI0007F967D9|nr:hypothetical protein [Lentilactobacillus parabuchneri]OBU97838.1 hypothetical protein A7B51_00240 [Lentilactobacillus parabuchneri]